MEREKTKKLISFLSKQNDIFIQKFSDLGFGLKPFDFFVLVDGKFFAFEVKEAESGRGFQEEVFSFKQFKKHQIEALKKINRCGGSAYGLIFFEDSENFILLKNPWERRVSVIHLALLKKKKLFFSKETFLKFLRRTSKKPK